MNARSTQDSACLPCCWRFALPAAPRRSSDKQKKLYRWVDKNGQVHYGDSVPAEYAEQDRDVLNRQGVSVGREEGTITPEEAAAKAAEEKAARDEQKRKLRDRVLLQTYQSVQGDRGAARQPPRPRRRAAHDPGTVARRTCARSARRSSARRRASRQ